MGKRRFFGSCFILFLLFSLLLTACQGENYIIESDGGLLASSDTNISIKEKVETVKKKRNPTVTDYVLSKEGENKKEKEVIEINTKNYKKPEKMDEAMKDLSASLLNSSTSFTSELFNLFRQEFSHLL